jgi:hypothetical protein
MKYIGGSQWQGVLAGTPFTVTVGSQDKIDLPFVNDPQVIGEWESVDFVVHASDFNPNKPKPRTTVKEVVHVLGEPTGYFWGDDAHVHQGKRLPDNPPDFYVLRYPQGISVAVGGGNVVELRSEGQGQGFTYHGKLHLGSSLDDVLDVLGQPTETVTNKPLGFDAGVLYKDIDGKKGYSYYARPDQNIRCFFMNNQVTALYVTLDTSNR